MDLKAALKGQYRAGLAMLRSCVEHCPDEVWTSGKHPRTFWRIAYHALFYTHLYLMQEEKDFQPWDKHCWHGRILWVDDEEGLPPETHPYTQGELVEYLQMIDRNLDIWVDRLDLEAPEAGFSWYSVPKIDHQMVNIRHLGVHVGQLQELLYEHGIDTGWVSRG